MAETPISAPQVRRLQTIWRLLAAQQDFDPHNREFRLLWVGGQINRGLASFKDLTRQEAVLAIDAIQRCLPAHLVQKRRRPDRRTAKSYGTAGRKNRQQGAGSREQVIDLIDAPTWKLIEKLMGKVGWTRAQLDAFVLSPHGPKRLVTLADANKVIWPMKQMVRRKEKIENGT